MSDSIIEKNRKLEQLSFSKKYLKYKKKYLNLLNILQNGGIDFSPEEKEMFARAKVARSNLRANPSLSKPNTSLYTPEEKEIFARAKVSRSDSRTNPITERPVKPIANSNIYTQNSNPVLPQEYEKPIITQKYKRPPISNPLIPQEYENPILPQKYEKLERPPLSNPLIPQEYNEPEKYEDVYDRMEAQRVRKEIREAKEKLNKLGLPHTKEYIDLMISKKWASHNRNIRM